MNNESLGVSNGRKSEEMPFKRRKRKYVYKQAKMKSQRNVTYNKKIKNTIHQHITDDGGQAMGEEMRHVQMSRWGKRTIHVREASSSNGYEAEGKFARRFVKKMN